MYIDKILQKATKAKKQPHWCIDHQKWETEKHDTVEPWNNQVQKAEDDDSYRTMRRRQTRGKTSEAYAQERQLAAAEAKMRRPADMSGAPGSPVKAPGQPGAPDPHRTWTGLPKDVVPHVGDDPHGMPPIAAGLGQTAFKRAMEKSLLKLMKAGEEEETLTQWMPPGTPRDPRERPMKWSPSEEEMAHMEGAERVTFPRHPKGHPQEGQWTGEHPIPKDPPLVDKPHPGSIAPPNMEEAFQKFQKMWVRKSTPRPFSVEDNLRFLMKADTSSEPTIGPEDVGNMGLHKGPAEMKHVLDVPGVGRCHVSNVIKGPGQAGHPQGRTMLVLTLPNGERQPFYKRTGTGTRPRDKGNEGPSDGGSWVPIDGIDTGGKYSPGWFDKARTTAFADSNDPLMRYGNEMYKQVGASLDSLNEAGKIATADDLVAAGHTKVSGVADPNEEGPWSRLEINNWLGNDTAVGHNEFAHEYRDGMGSSNWEHHNKQRQERGDSGAPHNGLPGREGEAPKDKPYREPSPRELAEQEEANPLHESAHHQWKADTHDHVAEHMAKPHHERDAEFNQYTKEMWNGQRHTWQDHEKHFHHAMSGFGRFVPKKGFPTDQRAAAKYDLPTSPDGLFSFSEIYPNIRERNRQSTGTAWEPSAYSEKKHGKGGTNEHDRGWYKDRNDYQFNKYPEIMQGIQHKDPVYERGRGSGLSLSPLTNDVVKQDKLMEEYMTHPQGGAGGHAFGKGMWGPRPEFLHPQHGEERDAADAQRNLNLQQKQGEAMRQMIPPEAPLRGGQYPGMQNALLKLMKAEEPQEETIEKWNPLSAVAGAAKGIAGGIKGGVNAYIGGVKAGQAQRQGWADNITDWADRVTTPKEKKDDQQKAIENALLKLMKGDELGQTGREAEIPKKFSPFNPNEELGPLRPSRLHGQGENPDYKHVSIEPGHDAGFRGGTVNPDHPDFPYGTRRDEGKPSEGSSFKRFVPEHLRRKHPSTPEEAMNLPTQEDMSFENPKWEPKIYRNSIENALLKFMKATPEEDEEAALAEARVRGLPSAKNPNRGAHTRAEQEARDVYRTPTSLPMTAGPIREGDKPEFVRDEFGHVKPSRAERNRALLTSHTDTSTDIEEPYSAGRTYEPTEQPAEGRRGPILSQNVRREDRSVTAGERAEGAGIDTSVPFPAAMTQPNPEDMTALLAQEAKADKGGGENKGMKQPRKPIQSSLLKLRASGIHATHPKSSSMPNTSQMVSGEGGRPAMTAGQWKTTPGHGLGASGFPTPPEDEDNIHAATVPVTLEVEKSLLSLMKYGSTVKPSDVGMTRQNAMNMEKQPQERMSAEQIESQGGGGNPNLDPAGIGAEAAGMLGSLAGQAVSGQGKVQQYYADEAQKRMKEMQSGQPSGETAGDPQITGLMGNSGAQPNPPGNENAQTNPDMGPKMKFDQPNQTTNAQTPSSVPNNPHTGRNPYETKGLEEAKKKWAETNQTGTNPAGRTTVSQQVKKPPSPFGD